MTKFELPFIDVQRGRDGSPYHYFRRAGRRWRLPGAPLSDEFMAEYQRLLAETEPAEPAPRQATPPGSFGALVKEYFAAPEFKERKTSTQGEYRRVLEALTSQHGAKPVRLLERKHILRWRDDLADTPGAANTLVRMVRLILTFGIERGYRIDNPATRVKPLAVGFYRDWSDDECGAFESRWVPGTMQRRAFALAVYTGQRRSDLVVMTRAHRKDGCIRVVQQKTGAELWIPEVGALTAELDLCRHMAFLTTSRGKAFDAIYFGSWFAEAIEQAGLPPACVLHGLRKTAARRLAEAGCTDAEIMAITGHRTSAMIRHYTRGADQKRQATAAISKLENGR